MGDVLLFEFFPAFLSIVSVVVAVALFVANRRARHDPPTRRPTRPEIPPETQSADGANKRQIRRPSMSA